MVDGDSQFKPLGRPAGLDHAAVLQAGVEHQGVDRLALCQQGISTAPDAAQIGQIASRGIDAAAQALAQERGGGPVPAGNDELVTGLEQQGCRLKTDPGAATSEQDLARGSITVLINRHGICFRQDSILLIQ